MRSRTMFQNRLPLVSPVKDGRGSREGSVGEEGERG